MPISNDRPQMIKVPNNDDFKKPLIYLLKEDGAFVT